MSNPGVLTLSNKEISPTKSFRVEDNLGEAVHFHYNDIRVDMSISELLYLADVNNEAVYDLLGLDKFNMDDYDPDFLNSVSEKIIDIESVEFTSVPVEPLFFFTQNKIGVPIRRKIKKNDGHKGDAAGKDYLPVLFNSGDTVVYGREKILETREAGKTHIDIIRWHFVGGKHSISRHPWVKFLFKWDKKRVIKVFKKLAMKVLG